MKCLHGQITGGRWTKYLVQVSIKVGLLTTDSSQLFFKEDNKTY